MTRVLLGVSGGIAAYKVPAVVRGLRKAGITVSVVPTAAALNFVGSTTWQALSGNPVHSETADNSDQVAHVDLGKHADLVIIAPATANTMAKIANGIADNLLTNAVLMATCPILLAPAMHTQMWENPATRENVSKLKARGFHFVGPEAGQLTGADVGPGRMSEPEDILAAAFSLLAPQKRHFTISAGGTREEIDPVRFLGNKSTGLMGIALANAAVRAGNAVTLVGANIDAGVLAGLDSRVEYRAVETAAQLQAQMQSQVAGSDVLIMAAAVADYAVANPLDFKSKRQAKMTLELVENPDILAGLVKQRRPGQLVVGFAAETGDESQSYLEYGKAKAKRKGADLLVINEVGRERGFGSAATAVTVVDAGGTVVSEASGSKPEIAKTLIDLIEKELA